MRLSFACELLLGKTNVWGNSEVIFCVRSLLALTAALLNKCVVGLEWFWAERVLLIASAEN